MALLDQKNISDVKFIEPFFRMLYVFIYNNLHQHLEPVGENTRSKLYPKSILHTNSKQVVYSQWKSDKMNNKIYGNVYSNQTLYILNMADFWVSGVFCWCTLFSQCTKGTEELLTARKNETKWVMVKQLKEHLGKQSIIIIKVFLLIFIFKHPIQDKIVGFKIYITNTGLNYKQ